MNNETKIPIRLNLPKKKDQFESVSFVNGMTEHKLKVFIKRLWDHLMTLTNILDDKHKDIPRVIDKIMSGKRWTRNDIQDRYQYGEYDDVIIRYDTLDREFLVTDHNHKPVHKPIMAISATDINNRQKSNK